MSSFFLIFWKKVGIENVKKFLLWMSFSILWDPDIDSRTNFNVNISITFVIIQNGDFHFPNFLIPCKCYSIESKVKFLIYSKWFRIISFLESLSSSLLIYWVLEYRSITVANTFPQIISFNSCNNPIGGVYVNSAILQMRRLRCRMVTKLAWGPTTVSDRAGIWIRISESALSPELLFCVPCEWCPLELFSVSATSHRVQHWVIQVNRCKQDMEGFMEEKTGQVQFRAPWMWLRCLNTTWFAKGFTGELRADS